ncbi:aldose epimerase family protein [Ereboglobus luteus]|uniref:Aldose 1-epimerase n=1 Tax=Ereboglobus luteus TaxID=1796921 RepID=A0A2U8E4X9_9BACT|nr:aldose epimerase family protein [Ereboglobus luteus]AWI09870.1 galactose-1-epimerase [Ereboglobus luteus]
MKHTLVIASLLLASLMLGVTACSKRNETSAPTKSGLHRERFQKVIDGKQSDLFVLTNSKGVEICVTSYGARVVSWLVPGRDGKMEDIVLGYDNVQGYIDSNEPYFGAAIGRFGNRIAKGKFTLDGNEYTVPINNAPNALHGGTKGFQAVVWNTRQPDSRTLEFNIVSPDGDQGFPGNLGVKMVYTLTDDNELKITYEAMTDKPTVLNLTHHSFFNLLGAGNGSINDHLLTLNASRYTPVSDVLIPTGQIASVDGTPMDFRKPTVVGSRLDQNFEQLKNGAGYDHNWVLDRPASDAGTGKLFLAARVVEPRSGRVLEVRTDQPGIQFYGGNFLNDSFKGKQGKTYGHRSAIVLETQRFPDSPNQPAFPSTVLRPGETYRHICIYKTLVE